MVLNLPLDECIDNTHTKETREKRKRKETNKKKNSNKRSKAEKGKERDHLKKTSLGPLRKGQRLDTSETKTMLKQRAQTTKAHKSSPCTYASSP
jgi:hypothetical protein